MCAIEHSGGRMMKRVLSLLLAMILVLSMTACSKEEKISIHDTEMGKLEHQTVDVMGVTYDLFDSGYASIVSILHKDAMITDKVSYDGKKYEVVAIGFGWDTYNEKWKQDSVFYKNQYLPENSPEILVIPESIKYIGSNAFMFSTAKQIKIPSHITSLGGRTFSQCVNLELVEFPDSLNILNPTGMFGSCYSLKFVEFPAGCEHLNMETLSATFLDCYTLESAVIPGDFKKLENMVFWNCNELTDVTLCEGIETIGYQVFGNCPKLSTLVIPESVNLIEGQTIVNCPNLIDITLPDGLDDVPADMFLNEYNLPADVSKLTIRVEESMVSYVQSIYPAANVVSK